MTQQPSDRGRRPGQSEAYCRRLVMTNDEKPISISKTRMHNLRVLQEQQREADWLARLIRKAHR